LGLKEKLVVRFRMENQKAEDTKWVDRLFLSRSTEEHKRQSFS
jgi:hypothetical protein